MCGISGFLCTPTYEEAALHSAVLGMSCALVHRGPDDDGFWIDAAHGVALANRRLAILDLSPAGHQPMSSANGRYVVAFNGEIYNFRALHRDLELRGHRFRGHSDTEVLLAAVVEWGLTAALERFVGMFAFALWDRESHTLKLCRDRLGEKPLYYGWMGDVFLFGSELKALRAHPAWRGEVDRNALTLLLRYNYIPAPYSIYTGIHKLLPGTVLSIDRAAVGALPEPEPYWSAERAVTEGRAHPFRGTPREAADQLEILLRESIAGQLIADVPLGAFLSGGVDSSSVVALMQAQSNRPVRTFTIGFDESSQNEAVYAAAVARHLGTEHTELYVTPREAQDVIPRLPTLYDEPFADSSQIPTFLLSQLARRSVTVSLTGDGGDELFGGYNRYIIGRRIWGAAGRVPRLARLAAARALTAVPSRAFDAERGGAIARILPARWRHTQLGEKVRKVGQLLRATHPHEVYMNFVSQWNDPTSVVLRSHEPSSLADQPGEDPGLDAFTARMMYLDLVTYLPDDNLAKVDRAAMGVSLETRVPFLDHRLVEFAVGLPLGLKIRDGVGKAVLRDVLYRHVPRELIERPKMGFSVPIAHWLRGPLRDWAETLLDERRLREEGFFDPAPIRERWLQHVAGTHDAQDDLWSILMFQSWLEESHSLTDGSLASVS